MEPYYEQIREGEITSAVSKFADILEADVSEQAIHSFLEKHVYFILLPPVYDHFLAVTKPNLGSELQADFGLYGSCNGPWWTLIELERANDKLFNKNGDPSSKLVHAMRQVRDWRQWCEDNTDYSGKTFGNHLQVCRTHIVTGVIIGRRRDLSKSDRERLLQMNREHHYDWIMTYDGVLERAHAMTHIKDGAVIHKRAFPFAAFSQLQRDIGMDGIVGRARSALREVRHAIDDLRFDSGHV